MWHIRLSTLVLFLCVIAVKIKVLTSNIKYYLLHCPPEHMHVFVIEKCHAKFARVYVDGAYKQRFISIYDCISSKRHAYMRELMHF